MENRKTHYILTFLKNVVFILLSINILVSGNVKGLSQKVYNGEDRDVDYIRGIYLIIASNEQILTYLVNENLGGNFIEFKNSQGYDVVQWTVSDNISAEELREDILSFYNDNPLLEYVLLIGDVNASGYTIPTFTIPSINENELDVTDYNYTYTDDPINPHFLIGRWSIRSLSELWKVKAKTIQYTRMDNIDDYSYLNRALLVAGNFSGDEVPPNQWPVTPVWTSKWLQNELEEIGYSNIDTAFFHQGNYTEGDINPLIASSWNEGVGIINYRGWGDANGWHKPYFHKEEVGELNPSWELPIVFSFVCNTGDFGNDFGGIGLPQCFGEVLLIEGASFSSPKGAAAMIGPSDLDTDTRYNNVICGAMWDSILEGRTYELAAALHMGKQALITEFPANENNIVEFNHHIYGTIGDPSIPVWIGEPSNILCEINENLNESYIQTYITDESGNPIGDVVGALMYNGELISKGLSTENGELYIDFDNVNLGDELDLYLNKPQYFQEHIVLNFSNDNGSDYNAPQNVNFDVIPLINNQEYAVANEEIDLSLTLFNLSSQDYNNVSISLIETSEGVSGDNYFDQFNIDIEAYSSINTSSMFTGIVNNISKGSSIDFLVAIFIDGVQVGEYPISVMVGPLSSSDPMPPDNYGYWAYDHTDINYIEHPTYDWIEINPSDGGMGTNLGLVDDTITEVELPFSFMYYGNEYTTMNICSNGWAAFEPIDIPYFWNFSIPMPLGPSAMLAPYFDDLDDNGGSEEFNVFYWYDEENHRIVVQWDNVANGEDDDLCPDCVRETFQLILNDPEYYSTLTGDGEIIFQYQEINDIDGNGNFSTIGIESPSQDDGLQVLFAGNSHISSCSLIDGIGEMAIKFTTSPPENALLDVVNDYYQGYRIINAYPNPFNPMIKIDFSLEYAQEIKIEIFNIMGKQISTIDAGLKTSGYNSVIWNAAGFSSGNYLVRLKFEGGVTRTKMVTLLK